MCRRYWYYYSGNGSDGDPANYNIGPQDPSSICFGGRQKCAVYACASNANWRKPAAFSANLSSYCFSAKALTTPYPPGNPFVYTRPLN